MSMNSHFSEVYVNPISAGDAGTEEKAGLGPWLDFLLSSLHLRSLNSASEQPPLCVSTQGFCSNSNNMGEKINIIIAAFNLFVIKPLENSMQV